MRKRTKELLKKEYLARRASILGGDIRPLVTHSSNAQNVRLLLPLYQKKEKKKRKSKTIGGNRFWKQ